MQTMLKRINAAAILCLAVILTGCGGGDDPDAVSQRERSNHDGQPAASDPAELNYAPPGNEEQFTGEVNALNLAQGEREESGIIQTAGNEETTGTGIQRAAGVGDVFDGATIDGIPVFEEGEGDEQADAPEEKIVPPKEGTAEYYISEITKLRLGRPPQTKDLEKLREWQRERNLKIIEYAEKAIALTHNDPKQVRVFDVAINKLLETRLQLAVDGDKESVDALYEHASSLYKRDPDSAAAAEGAFTLVQLAFSNSTAAVMTGTVTKNSRWLQEFARQAEAYAMKFPKEEKRSIPLLFTAAETCELHGLTEEAVRAYSVIAQRFTKHPAAEVSVTILRRMKLKGKRIKLFGSTMQGTKVSLEQFSGKPIVVFFWSTEAQPAVKLIPEIEAAIKKHGQGLAVIGVCLDEKQETLEAFLAKQNLPWPNIFNTDEEKRGWNNPIVKFYGVRRIPAVWVIDPAGRVLATEVPAGQLEATIAGHNSPRTATQPRRTRNSKN